jgi:hypothetical protein
LITVTAVVQPGAKPGHRAAGGVSAVFVKLPVFFRFFDLDGRSLTVQRF